MTAQLIELCEMLRYARPHGSAVDDAFCKEYIECLPGVQKDTFGNYMVEVGSKPSTLFSAHTDTVDWEEGFKTILVDSTRQEIFTSNGECLGADDTTGIWIMRIMIEQKVPGMYVFHRGEEVGCLGSSWIAENKPDWLKQFDHAIAFDRAGDRDIITHQRSDRCASEEFAKDLSARLWGTGHINKTMHKPAHGMYTDTAEYVHLIGECTNISVGYEDQHCPSETQCIDTLKELVPAVLKMDWKGITKQRAPEARKVFSYGNLAYSRWDATANDYEYDFPDSAANAQTYRPDGGLYPEKKELEDFIQYFPQQAAELLSDLGATVDDICYAMEKYPTDFDEDDLTIDDYPGLTDADDQSMVI